MGRTICIVSGKGGVGKTFLTGNLGISLAKRGISVCCIDADIAMANLSLLLGMQNSPITLHDVLLGEASIQDAIYDAPMGLKFIPSGLSLENYRRVDSDRLSSVISSIQKKFDFVLVDGPAGIEKNVLAAIAACEETLLVTVPDSPSIADVLKTKIVAQRLGNRPIGVVVNMVRGDKGEIVKDDISKMLELPVFATVPYDDEVRKSFLYEKVQPVVLRQPNSKAAVEIQKIAAKLAGIPVKESEPVRRRQGGFGIMRFLRHLFRFGKKKEDTLQELEFEQ